MRGVRMANKGATHKAVRSSCIPLALPSIAMPSAKLASPPPLSACLLPPALLPCTLPASPPAASGP